MCHAPCISQDAFRILAACTNSVYVHCRNTSDPRIATRDDARGLCTCSTRRVISVRAASTARDEPANTTWRLAPSGLTAEIYAACADKRAAQSTFNRVQARLYVCTRLFPKGVDGRAGTANEKPNHLCRHNDDSCLVLHIGTQVNATSGWEEKQEGTDAERLCGLDHSQHDEQGVPPSQW